MMETEKFLSGFVAILGRSNVGKSTLLNAMIGGKVAIVSDRPQTTRNRILGVLTRENCQLVFIDTPGVHTPYNKLGEFMVGQAYGALDAVEAVIMVVDAKAGVGKGDQMLLERLKGSKAPLIVLLNKKDTASPEQMSAAREAVSECGASLIYEASALTGEGLDKLEEALVSFMPEGPRYFPEDMITDQPERNIAAEIIREKALHNLREEIPHGIGVEIMYIREREGGGMLDINATIYCEKNSHKGIIIGKQGDMLKRIGSQARQDIEALFGRKVFLELWVKVRDDWRNKTGALRELGYDQKG